MLTDERLRRHLAQFISELSMHTEPPESVVERHGPADDLDDFVSYEDEDGLVVCEKTNPKAWLCSDETRPLRP